jgi:hypothetical protein
VFGLRDSGGGDSIHTSDVLYVFLVGWMVYLYRTECRGVGDAKICFCCSTYISCLSLINPSLSHSYVDSYLIFGVRD